MQTLGILVSVIVSLTVVHGRYLRDPNRDRDILEDAFSNERFPDKDSSSSSSEDPHDKENCDKHLLVGCRWAYDCKGLNQHWYQKVSKAQFALPEFCLIRHNISDSASTTISKLIMSSDMSHFLGLFPFFL